MFESNLSFAPLTRACSQTQFYLMPKTYSPVCEQFAINKESISDLPGLNFTNDDVLSHSGKIFFPVVERSRTKKDQYRNETKQCLSAVKHNNLSI